MNRARTTVWTVAALATTALVTAGSAGAGAPPNVTGQKFGDASSVLSDAGFKPVVSTTVGDRAKWPDCLVSNTVARTVQPPPNSSGSPTVEALVSLDCDSAEASSKGPGYSAASPEGRKIAADAKAAQAKKAAKTAAKTGS